jgi:ABC-type Fe3+/spermidine/putrescine transport system ATPase subunit
MIFQNYALWPHLSIFQNVEYGLRMREPPELAELESPWWSRLFFFTKPYYGVRNLFKRKDKVKYEEKKAERDPKYEFRRKKVYEALSMVHLEDQADKLPTQLSGGQQQRIALCRAIVVEPDVLLCDEPLSNLDAKLRKEIRTEIRSIIKKIGMTTVYVTHDQEEALAISDRIAVLHEGIIQQYGTPLEVFTNPATLFVAQFIGTSSTLEGKVIKPNVVELKGGEQILTQVKADIPVGTEVSCVVRPEHVSLTTKTDCAIEFVINTIEYLGTEVKMTGTLKDESLLLLDVAEQAEEFAQMKVGDTVTGYIDPKEVFVFIGQERQY